MEFKIVKNDQYGSYEVYFPEKPAEEVREALKALRMRWNGKKSCWYGFASAEDITAAINSPCADDPAPVAFSVPDPVPVDVGTLYEGWEGGNFRAWHSEKELKAFLLDDFKRAGVRASVRFNQSGYLTSLTCTLTVKAEEVRSFEEWQCWRGETYIKPGNWYSYTDQAGKRCEIFGERFYDLESNSEEAAAIRAAIDRDLYGAALASFKHNNISTNCRAAELLKPSALARFETVQSIVDSYNRDCSNSMVDFFDRAIYDNYSIKIA